MKYLRFISLIIFSALLLSCSAGGGGGDGGGGGNDSSGTHDVTIVIDNRGGSASIIEEKNTLLAGLGDFLSILLPSEAVAGVIGPCEGDLAIPGAIDLISFSINGVNVLDVTVGEDPADDVDHCSALIRTFTVQNGINIFAATASGNEEVLYTGSTTQTINGNDSVQIIMESTSCTDPSLNEVPYSYDWNEGDNPQQSDRSDDDSFVYTLPWAFSFYGTYYNQITVGSNGNIWFDPPSIDEDIYEFDLATAGGQGPVIAAWNLDLISSDYHGEAEGYMVLHKTNPERVVIRWHTATFNDDSDYSDYYNEFEVVLYPNGNIRIDYNYFDCLYCDNEGMEDSGISRGNGSEYISLTDAFGDIDRLGGRSFLFSCAATGICVPSLLDPVDGEAEMDNGCIEEPNAVEWDFDWSDCEGATSYHLYVTRPEPRARVDVDDLTESSYSHIEPYSYISMFNREGWTWKVRAMVNGLWSAWSGERTFSVVEADSECPVEPEPSNCTRYVDDTGTDWEGQNDCRMSNIEAPRCRTISQALNAIGFDDLRSEVETICVGDGTYATEALPLQLPVNTGILCEGADHTSIIQGSGSAVMIRPEGPGTRVENCRLTTIEGANIAAAVVDYTITGDHYPMLISGNLIDPWRTTLAIQVNNPGSIVTGNTLRVTNVIDQLGSDGIWVGNSATITSNDITGFKVGIFVLDASNADNDPTISQNNIYCNSITNFFTSEQTQTGTEIDVRNNAWNSSPPSTAFSSNADPAGCGTLVDICYGANGVSPLFNPDNGQAPGATACE